MNQAIQNCASGKKNLNIYIYTEIYFNGFLNVCYVSTYNILWYIHGIKTNVEIIYFYKGFPKELKESYILIKSALVQ